MTKTHTVASEVWHKGIQYLPGDPLSLTEAEAKYLGHALAVPEVAPAPVEAEVEDAKPAPKRKPHTKAEAADDGHAE